jgi:hypothetical protein
MSQNDMIPNKELEFIICKSAMQSHIDNLRGNRDTWRSQAYSLAERIKELDIYIRQLEDMK